MNGDEFFYDQSFETDESSVISAAFYDAEGQYLLVRLLDGTDYVYGNFPENRWRDFEGAEPKGTYWSNTLTKWYDYESKGVYNAVWRATHTPANAVSAWGDDPFPVGTRVLVTHGGGWDGPGTVKHDNSDGSGIWIVACEGNGQEGGFYRDSLSLLQNDMSPVETLVPAAGAPSAARYEVVWTSGGVKSVFEATAHDENGAIVEFNDIISRVGLADVKIVSVTHYF